MKPIEAGWYWATWWNKRPSSKEAAVNREIVLVVETHAGLAVKRAGVSALQDFNRFTEWSARLADPGEAK